MDATLVLVLGVLPFMATVIAVFLLYLSPARHIRTAAICFALFWVLLFGGVFAGYALDNKAGVIASNVWLHFAGISFCGVVLAGVLLGWTYANKKEPTGEYSTYGFIGAVIAAAIMALIFMSTFVPVQAEQHELIAQAEEHQQEQTEEAAKSVAAAIERYDDSIAEAVAVHRKSAFHDDYIIAVKYPDGTQERFFYKTRQDAFDDKATDIILYSQDDGARERMIVVPSDEIIIAPSGNSMQGWGTQNCV